MGAKDLGSNPNHRAINNMAQWCNGSHAGLYRGNLSWNYKMSKDTQLEIRASNCKTNSLTNTFYILQDFNMV